MNQFYSMEENARLRRELAEAQKEVNFLVTSVTKTLDHYNLFQTLSICLIG